ncbi:MAG: hypothetical protein A2289_04115 [Deltaproteobacteria bacterium RIFOXYA12_FULL_58_15]|nr:MAG: hypothetical protein A2289_04115 [Deltaproteobacteria bacterium RIFOXYA12_FULL_58_15]OGR10341.1 MAG: hypothetical protein A2341_09130 [Deltaproteobacteria bacterium RIFOXYB12_FULL_58_9]
MAGLFSCASAIGPHDAAHSQATAETNAGATSRSCAAMDLDFDREDLNETVATLSADFGSAVGIDTWAEEHGRKPRLRFRNFRNRSMERIDLKPIASDLQKAMVATGKVDVLVEPGVGMEAIHVGDGDDGPDDSELGSELGADLVGAMELDSMEENNGNERIRIYTISVTLSEVETLSKLWIGDHRVSKMCELPKPRPVE